MSMLAKAALVLAMVALVLGGYMVFWLGDPIGIVALGIGATVAALAAAAAARAKKETDDARR